MTLPQVMAELKKYGNEQTRKTWTNHGATGDFFGVKVGDQKKIVKKIKGDQALAMELYKTGNLDAMYLAGLVANGSKMSRNEIESWAKAARWMMIGEFTVPWIASESAFGRELALKWMNSPKERLAAGGWNTYSGLVCTRPDDDLDLKEVDKLLERVKNEIHSAPNRVRYCMNGFVIAVGSSIRSLTAKAKATAKQIGIVEVDMGDTSCKVPDAIAMIDKIASMGRIGMKRKTMRC